MRNRKMEKLQERDYKVLFLLWEKEKVVHAQISFSKTPEVELRKHWLGLNKATKQLFADKTGSKPKMLMWEAGYIRRGIAVWYLQKWQSAFAEQGFEIAGKGYSLPTAEQPKRKWSDPYRLKAVSVDTLLQNIDCWSIQCKETKREEKAPTMKFTGERADETLCIRVTERVAAAFRQFCREKELTQSQGMAALLAGVNEKSGESILVDDLTGRLRIAEGRLQEASRQIQHLHECLEKEVQNKNYPKKYQAAQLQNDLVKTFFDRLTSPQFPGAIKPSSNNFHQLQCVASDLREYRYPEHDGVIFLYIERMVCGRKNNPPQFIYGTDLEGNKLKIRWYDKRSEQFAMSMKASPYFVVGAPWLIAVQKTGDVADMVGSLPVIDVDWSNTVKMEEILELQEIIQELEEYIDELEGERTMLVDKETNEEDYDEDDDEEGYEGDYGEGEHVPLDAVIRRIEKKGFGKA